MKKSLLVVDDDRNFTDDIKEFLEYSDSGYQFDVKSVRSIRAAKRELEMKKPDLCILDLMFPPDRGNIKGGIQDIIQGLDFQEVLLEKQIPTIVVTGALRWHRAKKYIRDGKYLEDKKNLLEKPVPMQELEETIIRVIENGGKKENN